MRIEIAIRAFTHTPRNVNVEAERDSVRDHEFMSINKVSYYMPSSFTKWQCCLLSALMSLAAVASCLYSPALPLMASSVGRSIQALQFLVVANLVGHTLGPLFYGVLANRWGRLATLRIGLSITMIGAALCLLAGFKASYSCLFLGCVLLTFGANVGLTIVLTMVKDRAKAQQRVNALVLLSFALLPGLAVLLGSLLLKVAVWHWLFVVLIAYCGLLLLCIRFLPETVPHRSVSLLSLHVLSEQRFWLACLILACVTGCFYTFNAQIPRIALSLLKLDLTHFGLYSNIPSLGMLIGNGLAIFLANRHAPMFNARLGLRVAGSVVVLMLAYCAWFMPSALSVFIFIGLLNIGLQMIFPAIVTLALASSDNNASAASFLAIIQSACAAIMVALGNLWPATSYLSLPLSNGAIILLACLLYVRLKRLA